MKGGDTRTGADGLERTVAGSERTVAEVERGLATLERHLIGLSGRLRTAERRVVLAIPTVIRLNGRRQVRRGC
jgi:hypothetical protein